MRKRRGETESGLFANPYVVLADLLIATFFVMVLYAQLDRLTAADPSYKEIEGFKQDLAAHLVRFWGTAAQDERNSMRGRSQGSATADAEREWWTTLPANTEVIVKQDATYVKMILYGRDDANAIFAPRSAELTRRGRDLVGRVAGCLATSEAAHQLVARKAIVAISIEGHGGNEGWSSDAQSWSVSLDRALSAARALEQAGGPVERQYREGHPRAPVVLSPGRFIVQSRAHYQNLPYTPSTSPANRRVQIEVRFTQRFDE